MSWDKSKWDNFISDNTKIPRTDDVSKDAKDDAKELSDTYQEDVDTDSLGITRVKKMLRELAATITGTQGPKGDAGTENPNALNNITSSQHYDFTNPAAPGGSTTETFDLLTLGAGELDGSEDIIVIRCSTYNIASLKLLWTPRDVPGNPGIVARNLWPATALAGNIDGSGYLEFYITEVADPLNSNNKSAVASICMGNITLQVDANQQIQWSDGTEIESWMAIGGAISIQITSTTAATFGIMI